MGECKEPSSTITTVARATVTISFQVASDAWSGREPNLDRAFREADDTARRQLNELFRNLNPKAKARLHKIESIALEVSRREDR